MWVGRLGAPSDIDRFGSRSAASATRVAMPTYEHRSPTRDRQNGVATRSNGDHEGGVATRRMSCYRRIGRPSGARAWRCDLYGAHRETGWPPVRRQCNTTKDRTNVNGLARESHGRIGDPSYVVPPADWQTVRRQSVAMRPDAHRKAMNVILRKAGADDGRSAMRQTVRRAHRALGRVVRARTAIRPRSPIDFSM